MGPSLTTSSPAESGRNEIEEMLARIEAASRRGAKRLALRFADRLYRVGGPHPLLAEVYARALLSAGDPQSALGIIEKTTGTISNPSLQALLIESNTSLGRLKFAETAALDASKRFAISPRDPLMLAIKGVLVNPNCEISMLSGWDHEFRPWTLSRDSRGSIFFQDTGLPLEGLEFSFDARAEFVDRDLKGWIKLDWSWRTEISISARSAEGVEVAAKIGPADGEGRRTFSILNVPGSEPVFVEAHLLNGDILPFPDTPALRLSKTPTKEDLRGAFDNARSHRLSQPDPSKAPLPVDIIVPIHGGYEDVLCCIGSVLQTLPPGARLIAVDDASPDPALRRHLEDLAADGRLVLIRLEQNVGFPGAANVGMRHALNRDIILLNSDAEVFGDWVDRLALAAYATPFIATVTPLSNTGSISSYPTSQSEPSYSSSDAAAIDRLCGDLNSKVYLDAPSGVGFCLYIRRDCLREVGFFDETLFSLGYGEENDFCLRASATGWKHVIAADTFVRHTGGKSFGARKTALIERNAKILNAKYPGYDDYISGWRKDQPTFEVGRRLDIARLTGTTAKFRLLLTLNRFGGTNRLVEERCHMLADLGLRPLLLKPDLNGGLRIEVFGAKDDFGDLNFPYPDTHELLMATLAALPIDRLEIHHILDVPPLFLRHLDREFERLSVYVHDFTLFCPRVTLLQPGWTLCNQPSLGVCEACIAQNGGYLELEDGVRGLRRRTRSWLEVADEVITPSHDSAERFEIYFPDSRPRVTPWEDDRRVLGGKIPSAPRIRDDGSVRVALIGALGEAKGLEILTACARDARERGLPLEFILIGFTDDDLALMSEGPIFVTGRYNEDEAPAIIAREDPDLAFFPAVWPETWCFALSHALAAGLRCAAFDLGGLAERLRRNGGDHLLLKLGLSPSKINDALLAFARSPSHVQDVSSELNANDVTQFLASAEAAKGDPFSTRLNTTPQGAEHAQPIEIGVDLTPAAEPMLQDEGAAGKSSLKPFTPVGHRALSTVGDPSMAANTRAFTSSVEVLTLGKGVYAFTVKTASPQRMGEDGGLLLPAVHIGVGPGVPEEQVEFMSGIRNGAGWIYDHRDVLVLKINTPGTHILISTLRAPDMAALHVNVEKMDATRRGQAKPAPPLIPQTPPPMQLPNYPSASSVGQELGRGAEQGARLKLQINLRLANQRMMSSSDGGWAGMIGQNLAVEGFAILPLEAIPADQIQYKALAADGFETPWTSGGALCSARGVGAPLIGFAVRLAKGAERGFDIVYRGAFRTGAVVGPLANGAPCQVKGSPAILDAIEVAIVPKAAATTPQKREPTPQRIGPKFSIFRDE